MIAAFPVEQVLADTSVLIRGFPALLVGPGIASAIAVVPCFALLLPVTAFHATVVVVVVSALTRGIRAIFQRRLS
jgi:hypothetical protein